ncbi:class I SAM-dependent methyltransferase [Methanobacterium lacus]|uniref:class I SAM-dependent methyltransferase n=1 Tax=Methanobacterium lacus (strain AL-21) TaxID=877455 RepID=UPI001D116E04|nr:class I SAM-dependent methyltransferase [Methanobacterium lacus]
MKYNQIEGEINLEHVKEHFEEEAKEFDDTIVKLIPMYSQMIDSMILTIPQEVSDEFKVLDLGTGTGNVSKAIKEKFKHASIDCIDIAEKMIEMAKIKLEGYTDIHYYTGDFYEFEFEEKYDVVVSSLALHHIKTDDEKKKFYHKIYHILKEGGIFINSDSVLGSNERMQKLNKEKWKEFMLNNVSEDEVEDKWVPQSKKEDYPAPITNHLKWLEEAGFKDLDIVWKYYGWAVYCGTR